MPSASATAARSASVVAGTMRSTIVDGKATSSAIHLAELRRSQRGELRHDPLHGAAVGGEVVAAQHGEGRHARGAPARQRGHDEAAAPSAARRDVRGRARCRDGRSSSSPVCGVWQ